MPSITNIYLYYKLISYLLDGNIFSKMTLLGVPLEIMLYLKNTFFLKDDI